jgi:hypothetical protein
MNEYDWPFWRSVTVQVKGPTVHVQVLSPGTDVTTYDVMTLLPDDAGGVHVTAAEPLAATAATAVGAPGAPTGTVGVTALLAVDGGLDPAPFTARTVKVYAVPPARPVTVQVNGEPVPNLVHVWPPGDAVAT